MVQEESLKNDLNQIFTRNKGNKITVSKENLEELHKQKNIERFQQKK
jgi:hypothetical protein